MSELRIEHLEKAVEKIDHKIDGITDALQSLVRIEERQISTAERLNTGAGKMSDHEARIRAIEKEMPGLIEQRKWVVGGVLAGIGLIGMALLKLVLIS
jgi:hypothetical protein